VDAEQPRGTPANIPAICSVSSGCGSERRQHISQLRAEIIKARRVSSGLRVATGEIGRDDQHALARAELPERRVETGAQVSDGESVGGEPREYTAWLAPTAISEEV